MCQRCSHKGRQGRFCWRWFVFNVCILSRTAWASLWDERLVEQVVTNPAVLPERGDAVAVGRRLSHHSHTQRNGTHLWIKMLLIQPSKWLPPRRRVCWESVRSCSFWLFFRGWSSMRSRSLEEEEDKIRLRKNCWEETFLMMWPTSCLRFRLSIFNLK